MIYEAEIVLLAVSIGWKGLKHTNNIIIQLLRK